MPINALAAHEQIVMIDKQSETENSQNAIEIFLSHVWETLYRLLFIPEHQAVYNFLEYVIISTW